MFAGLTQDQVDNIKIVIKITAWQMDQSLHPLTCGNNSKHRVLIPGVNEYDAVILECQDCDYIQTHIPKCVLNKELK